MLLIKHYATSWITRNNVCCNWHIVIHEFFIIIFRNIPVQLHVSTRAPKRTSHKEERECLGKWEFLTFYHCNNFAGEETVVQISGRVYTCIFLAQNIQLKDTVHIILFNSQCSIGFTSFCIAKDKDLRIKFCALHNFHNACLTLFWTAQDRGYVRCRLRMAFSLYFPYIFH
jgi:hypothetical protein